MKKLFGAMLALLLGAGVLLGAAGTVQAEEEEKLTGKTAMEITSMMGAGFNIGNTFDATGGNVLDIYSHEKSWGNPVVTQELLQGIADAGFQTVRIPVTWNLNLIKDGSFTIQEAFLDRVQEVVDYAYNCGLFVIINVHHESWINHQQLVEKEEEIAYQLYCVWEQIAERFAEYDQHLIFEVMNEPRLAGGPIEWNGNREAYRTVNYLSQVAVNAIRDNHDGQNPERCIMVPGYAASNSYQIMQSINLPTYDGEVVKNLIISVHSYAPYDFCLSDNWKDFDPNNSAHTAGITNMFRDLNELFLSKGIPVVIGETGATNSGDNMEARERWAFYMASQSASYGTPFVLWDNGNKDNKGGECHNYFDRKTGEQYSPTFIKALMDGVNSVEWGSAITTGGSGTEAPGNDFILDGTNVFLAANGKTSSKEWDNSFISFPHKNGYVAEGGDILLAYQGAGRVVMILDSEVKGQWWIPVEPTRVEDKDGYRVAVFTYDSMYAEMTKFGVTNPSDLRNISFVSADGDVTAYEVAVTGKLSSVTYFVNGEAYATGTDAVEAPEVARMEFLGWYTTKDYQPGTEFTPGTPVEGNVVVYAKLGFVQSMEELKPTPTPTPTPRPTRVPTEAPTEAPAGTDATIAKKGNGNANLVIIIVAAVVVAAGVVAAVVFRKKK